MKIIEILENGCIIPGEEADGKITTYPYIETGDHYKARELLSSENYSIAQGFWTPDVIAVRQAELEEQAMHGLQ